LLAAKNREGATAPPVATALREAPSLAPPPGLLEGGGRGARLSFGGGACLSSLLGVGGSVVGRAAAGVVAADGSAAALEACEGGVVGGSFFGGEGQMVQLVSTQRDRARKEAERSGEEAARLKGTLRQSEARCQKLEADNLELYEQLRFVKSSMSPTTETPLSRLERGQHQEEATEGRYRALYDERLNPFAAFKKRERQQRYAELNVAEKLMLNFSSFFLQNRHARIFLFGYMVCLHVLIWASIYSHMLHHGVVHHGGRHGGGHQGPNTS
jgi:hypothetical protein|tara:strand:- start:471 stop:1280 length:810 start_codon:yes stop_codon:yes gene_type:complete